MDFDVLCVNKRDVGYHLVQSRGIKQRWWGGLGDMSRESEAKIDETQALFQRVCTPYLFLK